MILLRIKDNFNPYKPLSVKDYYILFKLLEVQTFKGIDEINICSDELVW